MPPALPDRPPFSIRARILTPLAAGGTKHEPDGVVAVDAEGSLAFVGPAAEAPPDLLPGAVDARPVSSTRTPTCRSSRTPASGSPWTF